jgi:hypothetical protein
MPREAVKSPPRTFWGMNIRTGAAAQLENQDFRARPKTVARPPDFEKTSALTFLKATYPQIPY